MIFGSCESLELVEEKNCTAHRDAYLKFFDRYDHRDFCLAYAFTYRYTFGQITLNFKMEMVVFKSTNLPVTGTFTTEPRGWRTRGQSATPHRIQDL